MDDLPVLAELSPVPRTDSKKRTPILAEVPEIIRKHPQRRRRMRLSFAIEVLEWAIPPMLRGPDFHILDPLVGFGTTYFAARALELGHVIGADKDPAVVATWEAISPEHRTFFFEDCLETTFAQRGARLLLTSIPFANSKHEGRSKMQRQRNADLGLGEGGQDYQDLSIWRNKDLMVPHFASILATWARGLLPWSRVLVHTRDFVAGGQRVDARLWTVESMREARIVPEGYLRAPLGFLSPDKAAKKYPRRKVVVREGWPAAEKRRDYLECGHVKERPAEHALTETAHCTACPETGATQIMEDWIVVGEVQP